MVKGLQGVGAYVIVRPQWRALVLIWKLLNLKVIEVSFLGYSWDLIKGIFGYYPVITLGKVNIERMQKRLIAKHGNTIR